MKLKAYRQLFALSQEKLSKQIGVSELSVIKYESGANIPSKKVMQKIYELSSGAVAPNDFYELETIMVNNKIQNVSANSQETMQLAIGLMSGTSMDGIDASLISTDGERVVKDLGSCALNYTMDFKAKLKKAEAAVRECNGDLKLVKDSFPEFENVISESTDLHAQVVQQLLKQLGYRSTQIDLVGYHGQTLFHRPKQGITIQIGKGQSLADQLGIKVVYDFRSNDVKHGGQGAPFAPLYHEALALQMGLAPMVVANCGGISNITVITGQSAELTAFDCGPGNGLIDRFVQQRTGKQMDQDGNFGRQGKVDLEILKLLRKKAVVTADGSNYLEKSPPKSLDIADLKLITELQNLSLQDGCATLETFTADCIVESLNWLESKKIPLPLLWVLAGGGWNNPIIVGALERLLKAKLGEGVKVQHAEAVGWNGKALEAQIFAYLAVRSQRGLALSVPGTTGVPEPISGGVLVHPTKKSTR